MEVLKFMLAYRDQTADRRVIPIACKDCRDFPMITPSTLLAPCVGMRRQAVFQAIVNEAFRARRSTFIP